MSARPQTTFAAGRSPWPALPGQATQPAKAPLKAVKPAPRTRPNPTPQKIDIDHLVIVDDPLPPGHSLYAHKYDALFSKLKHGQGLKCEPDEAQALAKAMTHWLRRTKKEGQVTLCRDYPTDHKGRVWLLEPPKPAPKRKGGAA